MEIWETDKLALFLAFVIPGFISLKAYQLAFPGVERSTADQLIDAIAYSSVNYALLLPLIVLFETIELRHSCIVLYYLFYIFVFFIAPIIWVFIWRHLRTREFFQRNAPHPTAKPWDYVFAQRKPYWVKVTLKDGSIIAGRYADKSFASSSPAPEQLYLEETWVLDSDGTFQRAKNNTGGVIILSNEIAFVELRN